jgi:hypothetical protein
MSIGSKGEAFAEANKGNRAEFITDEHLEFLDDLRESGATNMFGAVPYVLREFPDLSEDQASAVLGYWMKTFSKPSR